MIPRLNFAFLVVLTIITSSAAQPVNDTCATASLLYCNAPPIAGTVTRTARWSNNCGDDPSAHNNCGNPTGDLREDVWYCLIVGGVGPQNVTIRVFPAAGSGLRLELGLFTYSCAAPIRLCGWATRGHRLTCCLAPGYYYVVVDEYRRRGRRRPAGNAFAIDALCVNWTPPTCDIQVDPRNGELKATGLLPGEALPCHVVSGPVAPGQPIPARAPGSASWVQADENGVLTSSDLEIPSNDDGNPSESEPGSKLADQFAPGTYSVIIDDGNGIYDPSVDCLTTFDTQAVQPSGHCLLTTLAAGNGQRGNMFDVHNNGTAPVTITSFEQNFMGNGGIAETVEVWTVNGGGTFVGQETNAAAWTLVSSTPVVTRPQGTLTAVEFGAAVTAPFAVIPPGGVQGFYATASTNTANVAYTNGTTIGAPAASNGVVTVDEGTGNAYPFGAAFTPRVWNGVVHYSVVGQAPQWELNSFTSSVDLDGNHSDGCSPAVTTACTGGQGMINFRSTNSLPWDAGISLGGVVPLANGGASTPGGQTLNLNLLGGLFFLNGGNVPALFTNFSNFSAPYTGTPVPSTASIQMFVIDPGHPDSISLSQACQLDTVATSSLPGPIGDDSFAEIDLAASGLCGPPSLSLFGTTYDRLYVSSNGRVTMGEGSTAWSPTVLAAANGLAMAGAWADLNPQGQPLINVSAPTSDVVRINFGQPGAPLPYYGGALGTGVSFFVEFDDATGGIHLGGLTGITPGSGNMLLGISPGGAGGATDPGATSFTAGASGIPSSSTDMLYAFGPAGPLAPGLQGIQFLPSLTLGGGYEWTAY